MSRHVLKNKRIIVTLNRGDGEGVGVAAKLVADGHPVHQPGITLLNLTRIRSNERESLG